jgi:hypothetical protein
MRCSAGFSRPQTRASLQPHSRHALHRFGPAFSAAIKKNCAGWSSPGLCKCSGESRPSCKKSAALPPGGANRRKRGCPPLAKRACPAGNAGRASAHGPGTSVYGEVQAACDSGLYTCGAVLMPAGHALDPATYCNVALTCAAPVESILYNMSASAMNQPLVHFSKGLCSVCGIEQVSDQELKGAGLQRQPCKEVGSMLIVRWRCCAGLQGQLCQKNQSAEQEGSARTETCACGAGTAPCGCAQGCLRGII